ncbi:hypothetical protein AZE42_07162 [Rhizopogon vesiculosus]|uniref:Uncharacterized protein n=1 Tax=Rhizopogon vesiculosus TaxID=180088 RepID=A0A1J8Q9L1_9AGAM|nr:hypothetical protein AZE42_07162 [Rhizopogon vesiculosus]
MPSASLSISYRPMPSPSPILAPDSTTQPVASHGIGVSMSTGMVGMVYNLSPGPYHSGYLSQNWVQPAMVEHAGKDEESGGRWIASCITNIVTTPIK